MFTDKITFHPGNNTDWQGKKMRPHRFLFKLILKWIKDFIKEKTRISPPHVAPPERSEIYQKKKKKLLSKKRVV